MAASLGGEIKPHGGFFLGKGRIDMVPDDPAQDGESPSDPRLDSLDMQLKKVRQAEKIRSAQRHAAPAKGMRQGNRVLTELIAGPAGGALLGWFIDRVASTTPWALLICLFLGIGVAFRNIYLISQERPE
jgi:ATP synthase protein I